jgi:hypothetical protein
VGRVAGRAGRARPGQQGGAVVEVLPDTRVARLATGPGAVTAIAAGPGGLLAVAAGDALRVWSLGTAPVVEVRAQYAPDRAAGPQDLLDADSDARGLAALIASADLVPPLAVGLFGAWGSGKSFLLERIKAFVETFTRAGRAEGYLEHVPVVTFNAWHYAETNLWAALVNDVLLAIRKECSPAWDADEKVRAAEQALADARLRVRRRFRTGLLAVAIVAVVVLAGVVLWRTGFVRWLWALGLVTAALGVADSMRKTASWLKDVGPLFSAIGGVWGARRRLTRAQLGAALARQDQPSEVTEAEELGGTIRKLVEDPEYRDLLGLVTRTRQRFQSLDDAVRAARKGDGGSLQLERVVVMIDDLDRCPPEKVVSVLEAVHLLFDFELFVVLLAVDTRWLEQSLRIRYRKLLGAHHGASPSDYLEKIIQIPLQVLPLDDSMIRRMLTGLTGAAAPEPAPAPLPAADDHAGVAPSAPADERAGREATKPRVQRSLAQVLTITPSDAAAMAAVVGLIGTTPRTVKRFVNTYRLLKARATDLSSFAERRDGVADDQIVAFLLALVTGRPGFTPLLTYLANGGPQATVRSLVTAMAPDGTPPDPGVTQLLAWLDSRPALAGASAPRCAGWASEVRRFTFLPPTP